MVNKFVRSICTICKDPKGFPHSDKYHPLVCGNVRCLDEDVRRRLTKLRLDIEDYRKDSGAEPFGGGN